MKLPTRIACLPALLLAASLLAGAQTAPTALPQILAGIDRAAATVHSLTADAAATTYTKLADDTSVETGTLAMEKTPQGPMLSLELTQPGARTFVYRDHTGYLYQPGIHQVTKYDLSGHQAVLNQFLLLGLGTTGEELTHAYSIAVDGAESLDGKPVLHLTLTPLDPELLKSVPKIDLWYDPSLWVAVQQRIWHVSGDYTQLHYTNLQINPKIPGSRFDTHFKGATVVTAHG